MATRVLIAAFAAIFAAACNPFGGGEFSCTTDEQCGATGRCTSSYCSFPSSSCTSGYQYGDLSGSLAGTCVGDEQPLDAGLDAKVFLDAPLPNVKCYGTGLAIACFTDFIPSGQVTLPAGTLDTGTSPLCATNVDMNPPWCVIAAASVTVAAGNVVVVGTKPLVLIATDTIDVTGTLDASSRRTPTEVIGAAADFGGCLAGTLPNATHAGGGAGGSFGGTGGNGGDGNQANSKGLAGAAQAATALRGGCPGQNGDGNGGAPGHGGGVVYLIADTSITVTGSINASGEGGQGGIHPSPGGGGGGGAGGLIGLDSPMVTVIGNVYSNGGGGGEGCGNTSNDGSTGNDPTVTGAPASGNTASGGAGAAGGVGAMANGGAGSNPDAGGSTGGGGGGAVGVIELDRATAIGGVGAVSPPHS